MSLQKIAHVPPPTVETDATVMDAVELMAEAGVGAVAVMEKDQLRGIFTERDVMLRVVLKNRNAARTHVSEVMTSPPQTVTDDLPMEEALNFLLEKHIRHLPIVRGKQVVSMLSIRDLMRVDMERMDEELRFLHEYLYTVPPEVAGKD